MPEHWTATLDADRTVHVSVERDPFTALRLSQDDGAVRLAGAPDEVRELLRVMCEFAGYKPEPTDVELIASFENGETEGRSKAVPELIERLGDEQRSRHWRDSLARALTTEAQLSEAAAQHAIGVFRSWLDTHGRG